MREANSYIIFEDDQTPDADWLRFEADRLGVWADRGGLVRLNRQECESLAEWLLKTAPKIRPPQHRGRAKA